MKKDSKKPRGSAGTLASPEPVNQVVEPPAALASLSDAMAGHEPAVQPVPKTEPASLIEDPELVGDFLLEAREHLSSVETNLLELERNPGATEVIHATFRSFHTIKGLAGFLGLAAVQQASHETETLLDLCRSGELTITASLIDVILRSADFLKGALDRIETAVASPGHASFEANAPKELMEALARATKGGEASAAAVLPEPEPEPAPAPQAPIIGASVPHSTPAPGPSQTAASQPGPVALTESNNAERASAGSSIKVDADKIEYLIDMVGELVIAQSIVRQHPGIVAALDTILSRNLAQLERVTGEVQKTAMSMRMAPVSSVFQKMSRVARDVARKSGKQVNLAIQGDDAEMDRKILDGLAEPLMHMIRNAVDHGLEMPDERLASKKNPTGTIWLRAERESGNIVIEIADDGRGLNAVKIRKKAIERGLIAESTRLSPEEVHRLIFEPGFSTAEKVTEFSGRGVGMDVVRRQVEYLRGRVEIRSVEGKGTTFTVRVPLTLATVDGLLIRVGTERYILPTFTVREIFRASEKAINTIANKNEVVEFRNSTIPLVRLAERLKTAGSVAAAPGVMIVIESGGRQFCLAADEVIGKQEVVIKTLGSIFRNQAGIAGGAILGDGRVGLILDLDDLLQTRYTAK